MAADCMAISISLPDSLLYMLFSHIRKRDHRAAEMFQLLTGQNRAGGSIPLSTQIGHSAPQFCSPGADRLLFRQNATNIRPSDEAHRTSAYTSLTDARALGSLRRRSFVNLKPDLLPSIAACYLASVQKELATKMKATDVDRTVHAVP